MVEVNEFQKGEKHMLRKIIMLCNHHKKINKLQQALSNMLIQYDEIFNDEYLQKY